jgi:hypothetical protein
MCYIMSEQFLLIHFVTFSCHRALVYAPPEPASTAPVDHLVCGPRAGRDGDLSPVWHQSPHLLPLARSRAAPTQPLRSHRLHTRRSPTWSTYELWILCELLCQHPTLGRGRLTQALNALTEAHWSPATVGRMLRQMQPRCQFCHGRNGRHRSRNWAMRKDLYALVGEALPLPLRPPPDPEVDFLIREAEAAKRHAQD